MKNVLIGFFAALAIVSIMAQVTQPGIPAGFTVPTVNGSCPSGWAENTTARGRTIYGLPSGGTNAGTIGTALSDLENRATGQHNHGITDGGHLHNLGLGGNHYADNNSGAQIASSNGSGTPGGTIDYQGGTTNGATTGITINNAGSVAGTNAPGIQYMYCTKQ